MAIDFEMVVGRQVEADTRLVPVAERLIVGAERRAEVDTIVLPAEVHTSVEAVDRTLVVVGSQGQAV